MLRYYSNRNSVSYLDEKIISFDLLFIQKPTFKNAFWILFIGYMYYPVLYFLRQIIKRFEFYTKLLSCDLLVQSYTYLEAGIFRYFYLYLLD